MLGDLRQQRYRWGGNLGERMLKRQEIRDKKSAPSLQGAQCPQAEPERLSKAPSIPSAWQEWESITPSPPAFPSLLLGRAWSWMCRGLCSLWEQLRVQDPERGQSGQLGPLLWDHLWHAGFPASLYFTICEAGIFPVPARFPSLHPHSNAVLLPREFGH